jgi:1-acyl-sn-glycerol-3-phosphate acyltransferase
VKWLAEKYLRLRGWKFTGEIPDLPKLLVIGAPHTTNWDFVLFLAALRHYEINVTYIGKHTLFRWPFGYFSRRWGGIPVDRSTPGGLVRQVVEAIDRVDEMILVMAPEGTRKAAPNWKGGFLRIAESAGIPIVFAYIDFPSKRAGIGPLIEYAGDPGGFMDQARDFYGDKSGLDVSKKGPIRLESETGSSS